MAFPENKYIWAYINYVYFVSPQIPVRAVTFEAGPSKTEPAPTEGKKPQDAKTATKQPVDLPTSKELEKPGKS